MKAHTFSLSHTPSQGSGFKGIERQNEQGEKSIPEVLWPGVVSGNSRGLRGMETLTHSHTQTHTHTVKGDRL